MEFDYEELRKKIKEKMPSEEIFARRLGISKTSLSLRFNNHLSFTQRDMCAAMRILQLPMEEAGRYFLRQKKTNWDEFI